MFSHFPRVNDLSCLSVFFQCKIEIELTVTKESSLDFLSFYPVRTTASDVFKKNLVNLC